MRQPADLTSVTYQALFAAIDEREPEEQSPQGEESDGDADAANTGADRSSMPDSEQSARDGVFPADAPVADAPSSAEDAVSRRAQALAELVDMVVDAGIRTICLDEAHHLRREWQRAIEDFTDALRSDDRVSGRIVTIALTATPPYDANPAEWERYERLCGPIDEEIFTPELVAQRNLCPHQDYVMFQATRPRRKPPRSCSAVSRPRMRWRQISLADPLSFDMKAIAAAGVALEGRVLYGRRRRRQHDHPDGYLALMALMNATGRHPARRLIRLVSANGRLPACRAPQAEAALQFVIATPDVFGKQLSARMKTWLSRLGVVEHGKVMFDNDDGAARRLMSSVGKLDSITRIVRHESAAIGERLRLLVLTDYIRKELKPDIGGERPMTTMGVIPIFETLRRAFAAEHAAVDGSSAPNGAPVARMGAISGGLVVIPADLRDETVPP
ncbi:MAG: DEAD/DEAH box helicase family protein [Bifidobacterium pullorum]